MQLDQPIGVGINEDQTVLRISKKISDRIQERLSKGSEFSSVDAYAEFVLEQVLDQIENEDKAAIQSKPAEVFSKEDQEDVEQRLRDLGYL
jgi:hypothetical protein